MVSKKEGNKETGNIIPDKMMDGKKMIWLTIVSLAWLWTANPKIQAILNDTKTNNINITKYKTGWIGHVASKRRGDKI